MIRRGLRGGRILGEIVTARVRNRRIDRIPIDPELAFPGIAADGIFDPSIVGTRCGEWAWMAHSVVDPSARRPERNLRVVTTHLASTAART